MRNAHKRAVNVFFTKYLSFELHDINRLRLKLCPFVHKKILVRAQTRQQNMP